LIGRETRSIAGAGGSTAERTGKQACIKCRCSCTGQV